MRGRALTGLIAALGAVLALAPNAGATGFRATFGGGPQGFEDGVLGGPADWSPVGGNPGGHISDSFGSGPQASVATPDAWAGDRSSAFGGTLSFDLRLDPPETGTVAARIVCSDCPNGSDDDLYHTFTAPATGEWKRFTARLVPTAGWTFGGNDPPPATQFGFIAALEDMLAVTVTVTDIDAGDVAYVDNFTFAASVRRRLTLSEARDGFAGKLTPKGACAASQRVIVYRQQGGPDARVGADRTNANGRYAVREPNAENGSYYARARRGFVAGTGTCLPAKSRNLRVG